MALRWHDRDSWLTFLSDSAPGRAGCTCLPVRISSDRRLPPFRILVLSHAAHTASLPIAPQDSSAGRTPMWQILLLVAVLVWLYAPVLGHLIGQWSHDPNYSHGVFVPAFSLFVLWHDRGRLASLPKRPAWSGLVLLLAAIGILTAGVLGAELFLARFSFLLAVAGLVVLVYGWNHLR